MILARHGESEYSALGLMNGDAAVPVGLTPRGREEARQLGEMLRGEPIGLCVTSAFPRARATADEALAGRDVPRLVVPELNDPLYGPYEGRSLDDYRAWAAGRPAAESPGPGGESRLAIVERYARALRILLARPEETILAVCHSLPVAYALEARQGRAPAPRAPMVAYATPYPFTRAELEAATTLLAIGPPLRAGECHTTQVDLLERIEATIRAHEMIAPGGEVLCLVSGGPDSTCLYFALRELGYDVSALHVNFGLRGCESDDDARFCERELGAKIVAFDSRGASEDELRAIRYAQAPDRLRATGHTSTDQVETILYRLVTSGNTKGIKPKREDGVVRPLLGVWREETEAFCRERGLIYRMDSSNPETVRGLIRGQILPLLETLHPAARANILRALDRRRTMPPALATLIDSPVGSKRVDIGGGLQAVREHDRVWLEQAPVELRGEVEWGGWRIRSAVPGLRVRGWRPGDRLAGRSKKVQDVFVDAKVPRSDREGWPLVVRGDEVVAVPGLVEAPGVEAVRA